MVEYIEKDQVLHIIYKNLKKIPSYINAIANEYEGKIENRIGINFPMSFVSSFYSKDKNNQNADLLVFLKKYSNNFYVIVYKKGDVITKLHEEFHAKYHMDEDHRKNVKKIWHSLDKESKKRIIEMLEKMKYPKDNEEILIDEFQAYFFTEQKNFFGKLRYN
jgi:hypothetical protein